MPHRNYVRSGTREGFVFRSVSQDGNEALRATPWPTHQPEGLIIASVNLISSLIAHQNGFDIKGVQSTLGFVSFLDHPSTTKNSPLVDMLLQAGAVIYVKTNIPTTLMVNHSKLHGASAKVHDTDS
jgi:hypothetical protein